MDKCTKCGTAITGSVSFLWRCTECGKSFSVDMGKLKKVKKCKEENPGRSLLKCPSCGSSMDNGSERIGCKCPGCNNMMIGNLDYFAGEERKKVSIKNSYEDIYNNPVKLKSDKTKYNKKRKIVLLAAIGAIIFGIGITFGIKQIINTYMNGQQAENPSGSENSDIQINENNNSDIQIIDSYYDGIDYNYHKFSFTAKNNTNEEINTLTLAINLLDKNGNIVSTTYPQNSTRLKPGQSIIMDASAKTNSDVCSAVVERYSYYYNDEFITEYVEESPEITFHSDSENTNIEDLELANTEEINDENIEYAEDETEGYTKADKSEEKFLKCIKHILKL